MRMFESWYREENRWILTIWCPMLIEAASHQLCLEVLYYGAFGNETKARQARERRQRLMILARQFRRITAPGGA